MKLESEMNFYLNLFDVTVTLKFDDSHGNRSEVVIPNRGRPHVKFERSF